jgi:hypothetical protein
LEKTPASTPFSASLQIYSTSPINLSQGPIGSTAASLGLRCWKDINRSTGLENTSPCPKILKIICINYNARYWSRKSGRIMKDIDFYLTNNNWKNTTIRPF